MELEPQMSDFNTPSNGNGYSTVLVESHEDRLQQVEAGLSAVSSQVAVLSDRTVSGHEHLSEKLGQVLDQVKVTNTQVQQIRDTVQFQGTRISTLVEKDKTRGATVKSFKKAGWGLSLVAGGVIAKELGQLVWAWLSR